MRTFLSAAGVGVLMSLLVFTPNAMGQATDPLAGTWTLNVAKSKFSPDPAPKSETRTYRTVGQEIKATSKTVDSSGKTSTQEWTVNYDGKDHPEIGDPDADSLSFKRIDAYNVEFTEKKAGKPVITGTRVIAKDGRTMTITSKGVNAKGQAINSALVFEKQ